MSKSREEDYANWEASRSVGTPYIERPDEIAAPQLLCWRDERRVCGPDCVAFNPAALDENGFPEPGPDVCLVLVTAKESLETQKSALQVQRKLYQIEVDRERRLGSRPVDPAGGR